MINISICEDEKNVRTYLSSLIEKQNVKYTIKEYSSGKSFWENEQKYDILFLDIQMNNDDSDIAVVSLAKNTY